jgi:TctA family transporter
MSTITLVMPGKGTQAVLVNDDGGSSSGRTRGVSKNWLKCGKGVGGGATGEAAGQKACTGRMSAALIALLVPCKGTKAVLVHVRRGTTVAILMHVHVVVVDFVSREK